MGIGLENELEKLLRGARQAARTLARSRSAEKNRALRLLADALRDNADEILAANRNDYEGAAMRGRSDAFLDRLKLDLARVEKIAVSVEQIEALPDPVSEVIAGWRRPNGLEITQVRVPIGVIAVIYESRPNVTIEAACLGFKAGNAVVLRGGSDALQTNRVLAGLVARSLAGAGLPPQAAVFVDQGDHDAIQVLKRRTDLLDLIVPRGGGELKRALDGSAVPVLPHFEGICHVYVDRAADLQMGQEICVNAKCSRPGVCNAMENLLVHSEVAPRFLGPLAKQLTTRGVEIRGCERTCRLLPEAVAAVDQDWDTEYLDLILAVKVVDDLEEALAFIARHGSGLADAIVTSDLVAARRFTEEVDSATVYVNASTRFTDGFEFGFGAETGISTNRLHARGPMGLRELTTYKYVIFGDGQVRE
jgi:glutamate-5-semialdehyde dehydrogenase